jgi:uncharacterized damage-inducible protein DinB
VQRYFLEQAEGNRHINWTWLHVMATLPLVELDPSRGALFGSIFGTRNRLLLVDRHWKLRIKGKSSSNLPYP